MSNCKKASQLASKSMDTKLTWPEHFGLYLHISICGLCRRYFRDMKKLRTLMTTAGKSGRMLLPESVKLSTRSKERIQQVLNKAIANSSDDHD